MDTSRVDGVKAPQHRGTPRSHGRGGEHAHDAEHGRAAVEDLALEAALLLLGGALRREPKGVPEVEEEVAARAALACGERAPSRNCLSRGRGDGVAAAWSDEDAIDAIDAGSCP